jgi:hypothetical protein
VQIKERSEKNTKARLFILASEAYKYLTGEFPNYSKDLSWIDINVSTAPTVPSKNINVVVTNFLMTADSIAENTMTQW